MAKRKKHQITEYEKCLREYHKASPRHVIVLETDLLEDEKRHLFHQADLLRQCGNELLGIMKRHLDQLLRTKKYRGLRKSYGKISKSIKNLQQIKKLSNVQKQHLKDLQKDLRTISNLMNEMQKSYHVTWEYCRNTMKTLRLKYQQPSIFALSRAEDIWTAVSKVLYSDGTIRKGKKAWTKSKRYQKLQLRYRELCRVSAENRKLAIHEQVHKMRSLGDVFVTEAKNAKKLQKRANPEDPMDKNGKPKRKKRFGRSIKNRCPGYFQAKVQQLFESTGGTYIEVPPDYRASQYDHTADDYIKKKLSQRMYNLKDGTKVQRDWYSSFLLYCIDLITKTIDRQKCLAIFEIQLNKEHELIEEIIRLKKRIMNSGIRVAA